MNKFLLQLLIFTLTTQSIISQNFWKPKKTGFLFNYNYTDNFITKNKDHYFSSKVIKPQVFYNLGNLQSINIELIVQPQYQLIEHQLLNKYYVTDDQVNFEEKREAYTKLKKINLYAFELGLLFKKEIINRIEIQSVLGLGLGGIDTTTERLAKGFTFIENISLGLNYKSSSTLDFYLGSSLGHISNFNTQKPNSGFNFMGFETGITYKL